jgi:thiol-disulfide isomerase/thioredoxin
MLAVNLGPLAMPIGPLLLIGALLVAGAVGRVAGRAQKIGIGYVLTDMLLGGFAVARLVFVVMWFDIYRASPWTMLDIRDGGFNPWAGIAAGALVAIWHSWRRAALRKPLVIGLAAGALAWGALTGAFYLIDRSTLMPKVALATLTGEPTDLAAQAAGRPTVVNLWATWCPPCRREMPVLAAAQKKETEIRFLFADQSENAAMVQRYLAETKLEIGNVLLDVDGAIAREVGSIGLPTTLFYNAEGRLVDTHVGALSEATLASKLARLRAQAAK